MRMKKKLLCVLLAIVLAVGLLPAAARAAYVYAVNVEAAVPMAGQTPAEVAPAVGSDETSVYAYDWYDNGERMSSWYDQFEKGKTYTLAVAVSSSKDFYVDMKTYINGQQVQWTKLSDNLVRLTADFTVTQEQLDDLTVTLPHAMPGSKMSKVAEEGVVEGTEGAVIQAIFWYLNGEEVAPKNLFKADTTYEAGIRLYAREGYRFAVPLRVTCNGQTFDNVAGDGETAYFKIQYSTDAKGQTAGSVDASVKEPKTGEKPAPYVSISGGGGFGMINWSDTAPYEFYRNATEWFDLTAQTPQSYEDPFLEGHAYRVTLHCILYDGYEWPEASPHRINGKAPTGIDQQGDELTLSYDFPPLDSTATLKHVDAVSFEVDAPAIGEKPTKVWQKSAENPYNVFQWNNQLKCNGTRWFERDGNGKRVKELGENDVFEANKQYELEAMIFCQSGYCFTDEAVSNAKINDQLAATVRSDDKTEMTLTLVFPALTSSAKAIEAVDIGVTAPVGGAHPLYGFTTGSPLLTPYPTIKELEDLGVENSILWGDENGKLPPGGIFAAGTDYTVLIFIQVDPDYYIPSNAAVTVNGAAPKDWDFNADAHALSVRTTLTAKQAKTPITTVSLGAEPPTAGAHPDFSFEIFSGECISISGSDAPEIQAMCKEYEAMGFHNGVFWGIDGPEDPMAEDDVFEEGKTYMLVLAVLAKDGYKFDNDLKGVLPEILINGLEAEVIDGEFGGEYSILYVGKEYVCGPAKKPEKVLSGIAITTPPTKTEYTAGQTFDPAGMVVTATYSDGTTDTVTGYTVTPKMLTENDTFVTVSYTEGGVTQTAAVPVTVKAGEKVNPFIDVFKTDYYYDAVLWAYYAEPQVTNGMSATEFGPKLTVTRGQTVTFLWRAMGCPEPLSQENPFEDVEADAYYYKAVLWAVERGITIGTDATHFTPAQTCSTAHIITFLYRTLDIGSNGWYEEAGAWAQEAGLLAGLNTAVDPNVNCPRCDVVLFLQRAVGK